MMLKICVCLRKIGNDFPYFWRGSLSDLAKRESKLLPILKSFFYENQMCLSKITLFFLTAFFPAKPMVKFETDSIEIHFYQKYHKMSPFLCDQKIEIQMNKEKNTTKCPLFYV